MSESRAAVATILLCSLLIPGAAVAQLISPASPVKVVTLQHRPAEAALELIRPLLTPEGSVEIQPGTNTLVIRDSLRAMSQILLAIQAYDHPPQALRFSIRLVEATAGAGAKSGPLPEDLVRRLKGVFRYHAFRELGRAQVALHEGETIQRRVGNDFRLEFQLGAVADENRVRIQGFRIFRAHERQRPLLNTHLNLTLGQMLVLGLARNETSDRALMVVIDARVDDDAPDSQPVRDNPERR